MISVLLLLPSTVVALGDIWCQSGGNKDYAPAQCDAQTLECYKYVCSQTNYEDADFTARGCGVSLAKTATGLPNESCHQAMSICEQLGGKGECHLCSNKHICNAVAHSSLLPITALISILLAIVRL